MLTNLLIGVALFGLVACLAGIALAPFMALSAWWAWSTSREDRKQAKAIKRFLRSL